ncbi:hypothetical protein V1503_21945 [Bacillus sp. SCS-151]|uniref:hypothetical protein n=1 Tax=Nanhaiella sioensis TaxID=3115293 RepID=UPI00397C48E1
MDESKSEKNNVTEVVISGAEKDPVDLNKGSLHVEITLPITLFLENEIELIASDGIIEINDNGDGTVTCIMSTSKYEEMKQHMYDSLLETIAWVENNKGNAASFLHDNSITK